MSSQYLLRIRIISGCIFLFALLLIAKLYSLQIINNDVYVNKADRQYSSAAGNVFNRGTIYFQNKDGSLVSAATLQSGFTLAVNPEVLKDPEAAYAKLNAIFPVDHDTFIAKATKKNDPYEEIAKRVDVSIGPQIVALNIPGLQVYKDRWRFYPGGDLASHILGLVGYKGDEFAGRYGLERQYESTLARGNDAYVNFFAQIFSNLTALNSTSTRESGDIVTTIEPTVESYLQDELATTSKRWKAQAVGGIIMNPQNGEIYAMDVTPTFDPNNPQLVKNVSTFSNPLVENTYEMGSIIKPLTIAAGIDTGVITASSTYYDQGYVIVNNQRIGNFDTKVRGIVTMQDVLSQSLNVGVAHVAKLLGNKVFTEYFYDFGVGEKTGIDLPNEGRNLTSNLDSPRDIEHFTAAFGQGISLTPINTIRVLSTIANGGRLIEPHLVKEIDYKSGLSKTIPIVVGKRIIKESTAKEVAQMMVYSVDNVLANGAYKNPNYTVAVKTGTAQIAKPNGGGYSDIDFLHSFVGFFPASNPKYFIFLYMVKPQGAKFGSETLTSPFMDIVKFLTNYYEVPPDR